MAENYHGQLVKDAVITIPAYFNNAQDAKNAGALDGLKIARLVLMYDFGGGTFDSTLLEI